MSTPQANATFLPWIRVGFSNNITQEDIEEPFAPDKTVSEDETHASFRIDLDFEQDSVGTTVHVYGPGEIAAIDPKELIRVYPAANSGDMETNYFPFVEFKQPDFIWRYTPARPIEGLDRLRPWLVLVVIPEKDSSSNPAYLFEESKRKDALPVLTTEATELPDLFESWAWGHVQIDGWDASENLDDIIANEPQRIFSRLLCPRALASQTKYTAFLVPAFEQGRKRGLREDFNDPATQDWIHALEPAWHQGGGTIRLPVYFRWNFRTGELGDFEYLARQLLPPKRVQDISSDIGRVGMDVQHPADHLGIPAASSENLPLEGALAPPEEVAVPEPNADFVASLRDRLNSATILLESGTIEDRVVAPPLYGRWHAAKDRLELTLGRSWFEQINTHPTWRVAAGIGTEVVQRDQELLMAEAWDQVEGIMELNESLCEAQFSEELSDSIYRRHFKLLEKEELLQVCRPLHDKIPDSEAALSSAGSPGAGNALTIRSVWRESPVPTSIWDAAYRRLTRPVSPIGRRRVSFLIQNMATNEGELGANLTWNSTSNLSRLVNATGAIGSNVTLNTPDKLQQAILQHINPRRTIGPPLLERLKVANWTGWDKEKNGLVCVMASPVFDKPMYTALVELSPDWLLPGIGQIPENTITVLKTNPEFIESFMIGLNHEFSRELLWREYPTDQRGTYFRHFWDYRGLQESTGRNAPAEIHDIDQIHLWNDSPLGENLRGSGDELVLLIRGELLRRYPNTIIYAVKARKGQGDKPAIDPNGVRKDPVFYGKVSPDIHFLGFDFPGQRKHNWREVKGEDGPGWFFVLEEHSSEIRFGLDLHPSETVLPTKIDTWQDVTWSHVSKASSPYLTLDHGPSLKAGEVKDPAVPYGNQLSWLKNENTRSSYIAAITLQNPYRVFIHGSDMIP